MAYSTIVKKKCKCGKCNHYPTLGFDGYFYLHAPEEIKLRQGEKAKRSYQNKAKRQRNLTLSRKIHEVGKSGLAEKFKKKSELLRDADVVFAKFIKNRDSDKDGNVKCVCCGKTFNLSQKSGYVGSIVQVLHYIDRKVFSLRYDEDNAYCGCSTCNGNMFLNKTGTAHTMFRKYLIENLGEEAVLEMEVAHRKINKITEQQLKTVIEHYSQN